MWVFMTAIHRSESNIAEIIVIQKVEQQGAAPYLIPAMTTSIQPYL